MYCVLLTPRTQWQERWRSHGDWLSYSPSEMPYRNLEWRINKRTFNRVKKSRLSLRFPSYTQAGEAMSPLRQSEVLQEHSLPWSKTKLWINETMKGTFSFDWGLKHTKDIFFKLCSLFLILRLLLSLCELNVGYMLACYSDKANKLIYSKFVAPEEKMENYSSDKDSSYVMLNVNLAIA